MAFRSTGARAPYPVSRMAWRRSFAADIRIAPSVRRILLRRPPRCIVGKMRKGR